MLKCAYFFSTLCVVDSPACHLIRVSPSTSQDLSNGSPLPPMPLYPLRFHMTRGSTVMNLGSRKSLLLLPSTERSSVSIRAMDMLCGVGSLDLDRLPAWEA